MLCVALAPQGHGGGDAPELSPAMLPCCRATKFTGLCFWDVFPLLLSSPKSGGCGKRGHEVRQPPGCRLPSSTLGKRCLHRASGQG